MKRSLITLLLSLFFITACSPSEPKKPEPTTPESAVITLSVSGLPEGAFVPGVQLSNDSESYTLLAGEPVEVAPGTYRLSVTDQEVYDPSGRFHEYFSDQDGSEHTVSTGQNRTLEVVYQLSEGSVTARLQGAPSGGGATMNTRLADGSILRLADGETAHLPSSTTPYTFTFSDAEHEGTVLAATELSVAVVVGRNENVEVSNEYSPVGPGWRRLMSMPRGTQHQTYAFALGEGEYLVLSDGAITRVDLPSRVSWTVATVEGDRAVLLDDGALLTAGGYDADGFGSYLRDVVVTDVNTGKQTHLEPLPRSRPHHSLTALEDGRVLLAGGLHPTARDEVALSSLVIYDLDTGTAETLSAEMSEARIEHRAIQLEDGRVLLFGGFQAAVVHNIDVFDPVTNTVEIFATSGSDLRGASGLVVEDTFYLAAGGELSAFDLHTGSLMGAPVPLVESRRYYPAMSLLPDGRIMISGGSTNRDPTGLGAGADIFDPVSGTLASGPRLLGAKRGHATLSTDDGLLGFGGNSIEVLELPLPAE